MTPDRKGQRHAEDAPSAFAVIEQQDAAEAERYAQQLQRADLFLKKIMHPRIVKTGYMKCMVVLMPDGMKL